MVCKNWSIWGWATSDRNFCVSSIYDMNLGVLRQVLIMLRFQRDLFYCEGDQSGNIPDLFGDDSFIIEGAMMKRKWRKLLICFFIKHFLSWSLLNSFERCKKGMGGFLSLRRTFSHVSCLSLMLQMAARGLRHFGRKESFYKMTKEISSPIWLVWLLRVGSPNTRLLVVSRLRTHE